jgi:beta-glucosidase
MSRKVFFGHITLIKYSLYPFGYGLSYSKFEYSDLKLVIFFQNGKIVVSKLRKLLEKEVVQLYIRDLMVVYKTG